MQVGDVQTWERTFTNEDVQAFVALTGDQGVHHLVPDEMGRIMVHGLLTASLPTKVGGNWNYIAREMRFEFLHPVYVGDTIRCVVTITRLSEAEGRIAMQATWVCQNQHDREVLTGSTSGIIRQPSMNIVGRN